MTSNTSTNINFHVRGLTFRPQDRDLAWTASLVCGSHRIATLAAKLGGELEVEFTSQLLYERFIDSARDRHPRLSTLRAVDKEISILVYAAYCREMAQREAKDAIVFTRKDVPDTTFVAPAAPGASKLRVLGGAKLAFGFHFSLISGPNGQAEEGISAS